MPMQTVLLNILNTAKIMDKMHRKLRKVIVQGELNGIPVNKQVVWSNQCLFAKVKDQDISVFFSLAHVISELYSLPGNESSLHCVSRLYNNLYSSTYCNTGWVHLHYCKGTS